MVSGAALLAAAALALVPGDDPVAAVESAALAPAVTGRCDVVAARSGDDREAGSAERPVRTVRELMSRLPEGGVGCLRGGRFVEDVKVTRDAITLRSAPGTRATIRGRFWVAREATGVRVTDLRLDGRSPSGLPSPTVNGSEATFARNEVTNAHTGICFLLGSPGYGRPRGTRLLQNRIHGCGSLPATNLEHGIYVAEADATEITDNVIYDNADRGIQLYPNALGTRIRGNIIHGNGQGVIFSGAGGRAARRTVLRGNVITGSRIRHDVESYYPRRNPRGTRNVVKGNCIFGGRRGTVDRSGGGFTAFDNVMADPRFVAASRGDFRLRPGSPCAAILAGSRAPAGPAGALPLAPG